MSDQDAMRLNASARCLSAPTGEPPETAAGAVPTSPGGEGICVMWFEVSTSRCNLLVAYQSERRTQQGGGARANSDAERLCMRAHASAN